MDTRLLESHTGLSEESVDQMLVLAERLRQANGGELDDNAIQAVAEATGAPAEYIRLAVKLRTEQQKKSFFATLRSQYLTLEPNVRRSVVSGSSATLCALFAAAAEKADVLMYASRSATNASQLASPGSIFGIVGLLWLTLGLYNAAVARDSKTAAIAGAIFGGAYFTAHEIFSFMVRMPGYQTSALLIPFTLFGAVTGLVLQRLVSKYRDKLGLVDPVRERQDLLRQLVDLQDKLKSGEQSCTFLSVDIVGSTRMKELADPLAVEFTFNEYHQFIERVSRKYGGKIHSTAGDGVTCTFDHPQSAFLAARNIQTGLLELNTFRNKIGIPIRIRQAVHTGTIMTAQAGDLSSVNFAHVIDIAAHLQKCAPPGGVVVSEAAAAFLPGGSSAVGTERVTASGVSGTIWIPRPAPNFSGEGGPPPLPERV